MSRTDDFTLDTKRTLAERAGYRCSFLGCGAPTTGPSDESASSVTNNGMACHIAAASSGSGARRYIEYMTSVERKSIENGIWCCYDHGKIIDTDETRFAIQILKDWKSIAEEIARIMQDRNCSYGDAQKQFAFKDLSTDFIIITNPGVENDLIGNALHDCGVPLSWGTDITHTVRDFVIEITRNALSHGDAKKVKLEVKDNRIVLTDDGTHFNPKSLLTKDPLRGGSLAAKELVSRQIERIVWTYQYDGDLNISTIALLKKPEDIIKISPCTFTAEYRYIGRGQIEVKVANNCEDIYIVLPHFFSFSDTGLFTKSLANYDLKNKNVTFVTRHVSPAVVRMIKQNHPGCEVIEIR